MNLARTLVLGAALAASAACNAEKGSDTVVASQPVKPVAAPNGGDWSQAVVRTPEGGFLMGNPNAAVKLVEFGSMTCPHCADFDETGVKPLIEQYVKSGRVSYEFRNYVRDPYDITASLIARCGGEQSFFGLTRGLYAEQKSWIGKLQQVPPAEVETLQSLGAQEQFAKIADWAGFKDWAAQRGLPRAKAEACLADDAAATQLVQMNSDAGSTYNIPGTPAFLINGKLVEQVASWTALEPKLKAAVGG